ncbi:MAG: DUF5671 domain-containing protein [Patescibacteria group bacterium]
MEKQIVKSAPRDVFMYLLGTAALYFSVYAVLNILFNVIEANFPDPLNPYYEPSSAVRWSLALVVVIFPVYAWVSRFLAKDIKANPEKSALRVRKWLLYLTVFLSAALLIGDLVALVYNFLEGDLTTSFILKILSVFAVGAAVFWYYLYDLRREPGEFSPNAKKFAWAILALVAAVIISGFFVAGSPFRQRLSRFDSQKLGHLQEIQWRVVNYWQQKGKLPAALADLRDDISGFVPPVDPQTGEAYEYRAIVGLSFELCANFNLVSDAKTEGDYYSRPVPVGGSGGESGFDKLTAGWSHPADRYCFSRTIDPELYPRTPITGKPIL